jgi:hypothetical protein
MAPTFSIVVADYEGSVPRPVFRRKMACLAAQSCDDFEVLVYHDGPKKTPYEDDVRDNPVHPRTRFIVTETRSNDWGHSNRDRGIREAEGAWIIHSNADNLFYTTLVERLRAATQDDGQALRPLGQPFPILLKSFAKRLDRLLSTDFAQLRFELTREKEIIVYAILMRGLLPARKTYLRHPELAQSHALVFGGVPVRSGNIDAMQFVMRRDLWLQHGGWHDRSERSDGHMFEALAKRHGVFVVPEILGEHW